MLDMEQVWQFPCCWSAMDGCHISIKCPVGGLESSKEYHNFKNFYSIMLMGMVDAKYRFVWVSCGYPGNSHESIIMQSTTLWQDIAQGKILKMAQFFEHITTYFCVLRIFCVRENQLLIVLAATYHIY